MAVTPVRNMRVSDEVWGRWCVVAAGRGVSVTKLVLLAMERELGRGELVPAGVPGPRVVTSVTGVDLAHVSLSRDGPAIAGKVFRGPDPKGK